MNIQIEFNVPAAMRDGTVLRANIFRPTGEGPYPIALCRTPYNKDFTAVNESLDAIRLASAGYIVVIQDTRGRAASEGEWSPFRYEALDGYDTVEWAARLPGSSGKVGMFGPSYVGFTQWMAATQNPPSLKAIVPSVTWSDYRDGVGWRDGAFELGSIANWHLGVGVETLLKRIAHLPPAEQTQIMGALVYHTDHLHTDGYYSLPLKDFAPLRQLDLASALFDDAFVKPYSLETARLYSPAVFYDRMTTPAYNIGGWYDIFCQGTLNNFTALRANGSKLLMGPWTHGGIGNVVGQVDFGMVAGKWINLQFDLTGLTQRWFDYWLKGIDNGIIQEPPIRLFVMGANVWRDEDTWPLARTQWTPMYLRQGFALSFDPPASQEPADQYVYDPADPTPTWGGALLMHPLFIPGVRDQRDLERRSDVLSYTSAPLDQDMEVTGPVSVKLWAASDCRDTDFVARLIDVHPDGFAQNLCDGIIRARYRNGDTPELIEPGQPYAYTIDLWSTANVFKAGHRIRLDIASASFPRWDRNPNTGADFGASADMQAARQTILHDAARPSQVILPLIPR
jgi:putative CocE/NonD family hydrolase